MLVAKAYRVYDFGEFKLECQAFCTPFVTMITERLWLVLDSLAPQTAWGVGFQGLGY